MCHAARYSSTKEFLQFKETLFDQIEKQEQLAEKENERKLVKSEFSKKIRKGRAPRKMKMRG